MTIQQPPNSAVTDAADTTVDAMEDGFKTLSTDETVNLLLEPGGEDEAAEETSDSATTDEAEAAADTATAEVPAEKPPVQAGTSDKALQKLQQDQAAATRKIEALEAKLEAGETLTAADRKTATAARRKLDDVRDALAARAKGAAFDPFDTAEVMAEAQVETDDRMQKLEKELEQLRESVKGRQTQDAATESWSQAKTTYPGVNVESVWEKALSDAARMARVDLSKTAESDPSVQAVLSVASSLFHERADNAAKGIEGKKPPVPVVKQPTTRKPQPPVTPGGARVTQSTGVAIASDEPPSKDTEYINRAMALVVDE